ncbi:DUF317 domain-containing protein [Streptomyces sp. BH055]|uniref:DUF317 domain-containing protein n=1 Tax=Streptomyces sp. BH055 TaxID=3401173 RepID=UPI003BB498B0
MNTRPVRPRSPYLIAPAYLAGPDEHATQHLINSLHSAGWQDQALREVRVFHLRESDGLLEAIHNPAEPNPAYRDRLAVGWEITARRAPGIPAAWTVRFAPTTPPELITAFTTALTDPAHTAEPGKAPHYLNAPSLPAQATGPLEAAGWIRDVGSDGCAWYGPDEQAAAVTPTISRTPENDDPNWLFAARRAIDTTTLWHATAHPNTPTHLLTALCAAFASTRPVARATRPGPEIGPVTITRTAH